MKKIVPMLLAIVCSVFGGNLIFGQDKFDLRKVPSSGARFQDFIPKGWEIRTQGDTVEESEEFATGDLNGDGKDDIAFTMNYASKDGPYYESITVILLRTDAGQLRRAGISDRIVNGSAYDNFGLTSPPSLSIEKGVLTVRQQMVSNGLRDIDGYAHKFRFDPSSERFVLIGADSDYDDQQRKHNGLRISDNYLTSQRIVTRKIPGRGANAMEYVKQVDTKSAILQRRIYFEDTEVDQTTLVRLSGR